MKWLVIFILSSFILFRVSFNTLLFNALLFFSLAVKGSYPMLQITNLVFVEISIQFKKYSLTRVKKYYLLAHHRIFILYNVYFTLDAQVLQ